MIQRSRRKPFHFFPTSLNKRSPRHNYFIYNKQTNKSVHKKMLQQIQIVKARKLPLKINKSSIATWNLIKLSEKNYWVTWVLFCHQIFSWWMICTLYENPLTMCVNIGMECTFRYRLDFTKAQNWSPWTIHLVYASDEQWQVCYVYIICLMH
jgi:hypothetical protein